jgi:hypothetical protein
MRKSKKPNLIIEEQIKEINETNEVNVINKLNDLDKENLAFSATDDVEIGEGEQPEKKTIADYIIIGLLVISIGLLFLVRLQERINFLGFICILSIFIIVDVISPFHDYIKGSEYRNKLMKGMLLFRIVLFIIFSITSYLVLLSKYYDLKYTYWICFFSFLIMLIILVYNNIVNDYKKRSKKHKSYNLLASIGSSVFTIIFILYLSYSFLLSMITPQSEISVEQLAIPNYITIYKHDYDKNGIAKFDINNQITIDDRDDMNQIISELESRELKSLNTTDLLNYNKRKEQNAPYYHLSLEFIDSENGNRLFDSAVSTYLLITTNRTVSIEVFEYRRHIFGRDHTTIYPVQLSEKTTDLIFTYLDDFTHE